MNAILGKGGGSLNPRFGFERAVYGLLRRPDYQCLDELRRTQWLDQDSLKRLQKERLVELMKHVSVNVPFYRDIFADKHLRPEDFVDLDALRVLPIINKAIIRDHFSQFVSARPRGRLLEASTSGSTGTPFRYFRDPIGYSYSRAALLRMYEMAGFTLGERFVEITGFIIGQKGPVPQLKQSLSQIVRNFASLPAWAMDAHSISASINFLNKYKPAMVRGYSSALALISEQILAGKGLTHHPKVVVSFAEALTSGQRTLIEKGFQAPVRSTYGCSEGAVASECEFGNMHIAAENVIVEQLAPRRTEDGQTAGELILTFLQSQSFPLIRYQIDDWGLLAPSCLCPCGRSLPVLENVVGRSSDFLVTPDGRYYSAPGVENWFRGSGDQIETFQLVQESNGRVLLKVVPAISADSEEISRITNLVAEQLAPLKIEVDFVSEIPVGPTGKRRTVISTIGQTTRNI